jgi:hypothetical protein
LGVDLDHRWHNRTYSFVSQVAVTDVGGDTAAIRRTQQSSARYFQRPGREAHGGGGPFAATYDPTRTALRGYGMYARLAKEAGNWLWETSQNWRSPGYEVNDLGVLSRADYRWMNANLVRSWSRPGSWYRNLWISAGGQQQFNYDGDRNDAQLQANINGTLLSWWNFYGFVIHHPTVFDERLTRGGPTVKRWGYDFVSGGVSTDSRKSAVWDLSLQTARPIGNDEGGQVTVSPSVSLKPSPRVLLSLAPSWDHSRSAQQYVTSVADAAAPVGFAGRRYVFARVDQTTVSMNTRLNTTFTPNLTLELFAQPFLASGRYTNFKEFAEPRTDRVRVFGRDVGTVTPAAGSGGGGHVDAYTIDPDGAGPAAAFTVGNPDFNIRSLRGTAVMRWEYRPGSTLFFVWTQERSGADAYGDFDFNRDRAALFRDRPINVFQVKATYWIGR